MNAWDVLYAVVSSTEIEANSNDNPFAGSSVGLGCSWWLVVVFLLEATDPTSRHQVVIDGALGAVGARDKVLNNLHATTTILIDGAKKVADGDGLTRIPNWNLDGGLGKQFLVFFLAHDEVALLPGLKTTPSVVEIPGSSLV